MSLWNDPYCTCPETAILISGTAKFSGTIKPGRSLKTAGAALASCRHPAAHRGLSYPSTRLPVHHRAESVMGSNHAVEATQPTVGLPSISAEFVQATCLAVCTTVYWRIRRHRQRREDPSARRPHRKDRSLASQEREKRGARVKGKGERREKTCVRSSSQEGREGNEGKGKG